LYTRLREQLKDVAQILAARDETLKLKEEEAKALNDEVGFLKTKLTFLEDFFNQFQERQRMTTEKIMGIGEHSAGDKRVDVILHSSSGK